MLRFHFTTILIKQFLWNWTSLKYILQMLFSYCVTPKLALNFWLCSQLFCLSLPSTCIFLNLFFIFCYLFFLFSPLLVFFMEIWILPWRIGEALGALWAGSHFLGRNQVENRFPLWVETWASRHFVKPFEFLVSIGLMSFFWLIFYDLCYEGITPPLLNLYLSSTSQSLF